MKVLSKGYLKDLFVTVLGENHYKKSVLFIHGGPGLNSQALISYALKYNIFMELKANIIFYDQRACGKSKKGYKRNNYKDQIDDLKEILNSLKQDFNICLVVGHSYGAKLISDYQELEPLNCPIVYMASSGNINDARKNNIKLDLGYLVNHDYDLYKKIKNNEENMSLWEITKMLSSIFDENKKRVEVYWHDKSLMRQYFKVSQDLNLPVNKDVFYNIRKELYTSPNRLVHIKNGYHFIGEHDYIMNGANFKNTGQTVVFKRSAHYPHIEEPGKFCEKINQII